MHGESKCLARVRGSDLIRRYDEVLPMTTISMVRGTGRGFFSLAWRLRSATGIVMSAPLDGGAKAFDQMTLVYYEPASEVISRSGEECVVCLTDQWYIDYSQQEWKDQVCY